MFSFLPQNYDFLLKKKKITQHSVIISKNISKFANLKKKI